MPAKGEHQASHRVIADHLRATSFLIAEGVLPSNVGRGYVLRRIMRRAMRHAHLLGAKEPLMYRLVPALVQQMGETYPELVRGQALITETLKLEETRFRKTLEKGLGLLGEASAQPEEGRRVRRRHRLQALRHLRLPARPDAGRAEAARHQRSTPTAFDAAMEKQKEEARKAWKGSGEAATETRLVRGQASAPAPPTSWATTRRRPRARSAPSSRTARRSSSLKAGEEGALVLNQTPFYGESGGQVGDAGRHQGAKGALFRVTDTQKKLGDV